MHLRTVEFVVVDIFQSLILVRRLDLHPSRNNCTKLSPGWICALFARLQYKSPVKCDVTKHIQSGTTLNKVLTWLKRGFILRCN